MKVKICGIKSVDLAIQVVEEGADALGFVFAPSKRQVTAEQARDIIRELPEEVWKVGVFVNETPIKVREIADTAGLTHIQLHGDENPELYKEVKRPIIKSISVREKADLQRLDSFQTDYIILDSPPTSYQGGSGISFDWNLVTSAERRENMILAGGLNVANVKTAIAIVQPAMVDVSSGVETNGEKDLNKIRAFIDRAKGF